MPARDFVARKGAKLASWHPLRLIPISLLLGLIAAAMGGRYQRLAYTAVLVGAVSFFLGMTAAVIFKHPLW